MITNLNNTTESIIELIARRQVELGKTDEQLAQDLNFEGVSAFNLIKKGVVKLPILKVAPLASAFSIEASHLLRKLLTETMPDVLAAIETMLYPISLTQNEMKLIQTFRYLTKDNDVNPVVVEGNSIVALLVA